MQELGAPPGEDRFCRKAGLRKTDILFYWPRHSDLVAEAGATPNVFTTAIPEAALFEDYARVCLHLAKIPTLHELRIATRKLGTRTHTVFTRFGSIQGFLLRFRQWLETAPNQYRTILQFSGLDRHRAIERRSPGDDSLVSATAVLHPFLPAGLLALPSLATNKAPIGDHSASPPSALFEYRVADAFRALGFEVRPLGQGKGRSADCVAVARKEGYAVVIDAKARASGFVLGTEDRKFLEYAKHHAVDLHCEGVDRVYLCVVSSSFRSADIDQLRATLADAPIRAFGLWPAAVLMGVVEHSIRERSKFSLAELEEKFFQNAVVAP